MLWLVALCALVSIAQSVRVGMIANHRVIGTVHYSSSNISREQCVCQMIEANLFAANHYQTNGTCEAFSYNGSSISIQFNDNCSFIFVNRSSSMVTTIQSADSSPSLIDAFWSFDGTLNDEDLKYNGTAMNNASFCSPGITGYGSALCFDASRNQSVSINPTTPLNISFRSFTFEFWIYPYSFVGGDRGMIGQCQSLGNNLCLHMTIRNSQVRISFYGNACDGNATLVTNRWYHLAFVYNYSNSSQSTYIDGARDCFKQNSAPLQITNLTFIPLTIGVTYPLAPFYFDGLIDQLSLVEWARSTTEILEDATLAACYRFEGNSLSDSGPNRIPGIGVNITLQNNSLLFEGTNSYFQASGFVLLGTDNRSYSLSVWIKPLRTNASTILYSFGNNGSSGNWCSTHLGINVDGRIEARSRFSAGFIIVLGPRISASVWTHVAQTYSLKSGVSLYVNGSFYNKSSASEYRSGSTTLTIRLGGSYGDTNGTCLHTTVFGEAYVGWIDEFRVYSKELTTAEVQTLSAR